MTTPVEALDRLRRSAASGELDALCDRFDLDLVVSVARFVARTAGPRPGPP